VFQNIPGKGNTEEDLPPFKHLLAARERWKFNHGGRKGARVALL